MVANLVSKINKQIKQSFPFIIFITVQIFGGKVLPPVTKAN